MSDEFNTASSESPAVAFMHSWGQGFVKKDVDIIAKHLHHDYRHFIYPKSLGIPEATREEYLQHMRKVISLWSDNESTVHWITEAQGNLVIAHVTSKIKTAIGVETVRESIYIAEIITDDDKNLKIKQVKEFTDSKAHIDFVQEVMAAKHP